MFSCDVKVGRLLEVRLVAPVSVVDIDITRERLGLFFRTFPGKLVACGDFSRADVFLPDVATRVLETFKHDNPKIERSGILVSASAIFSIQLERLISQANNPARKCFRDPFEVKAFVGNLLTHDEHGRMAAFLSERV
ncbi:MAG TPA: hypothetical protein VIG99_03310 [Myxococcaceae bacterium]|jgi:hypothetical protein